MRGGRRLADKNFAKCRAIPREVIKPRDDNRPESLRVNQDRIQLVAPTKA